MIGDVLSDSSAGAQQHVFLLDIIDQCAAKQFPKVWTDRLRDDLRGKDPAVRARALALIRSRQLAGLDSELERIANSAQESNDLRTAALRIEEARALYQIQRADLLPTVNANAGFQRGR